MGNCVNEVRNIRIIEGNTYGIFFQYVTKNSVDGALRIDVSDPCSQFLGAHFLCFFVCVICVISSSLVFVSVFSSLYPWTITFLVLFITLSFIFKIYIKEIIYMPSKLSNRYTGYFTYSIEDTYFLLYL